MNDPVNEMFFYLLSCWCTSKVTHQPGCYIFIQQFSSNKSQLESFVFNESHVSKWVTVTVQWSVMSRENSINMHFKSMWSFIRHHIMFRFNFQILCGSAESDDTLGFGTEPKYTSTIVLIGSFGICPAVCKFSSITPVMYSNSSYLYLYPCSSVTAIICLTLFPQVESEMWPSVYVLAHRPAPADCSVTEN